jgi:maleate isomerase
MTRHAINYGTRARLGMLLASGNQAAEPQFRAMLPQGVSLHTTRLGLTGSSEQDLLSSVARVEDAAALVVDAGADLVLFQMTAVATFSAELEESILQRIALASGRPVTATSEALVAALRALSAKRIVMVSPYVKPVNEREAAFLRGFGFEVLGLAGLDCPTASAMMAVAPERWKSFALGHRDARADAYVISCTTVRSADVAEELEQELGRPVVTSNTAAAWHCLRKMGIQDRVSGFGRLLSQH